MKYKIKVNQKNLKLLGSILKIYNFKDGEDHSLEEEEEYIRVYSPKYFYINGNYFCSYLQGTILDDNDYIEIKNIKSIPLSKVKIKTLEYEIILPNNITVIKVNNELKFYEIIFN